MKLQAFTRWIVETADNAERGDTPAVLRSMIREMNYEDFLYDSSPSAKAAEMRMKNVTQLFSWVTQMLRRRRKRRADDAATSGDSFNLARHDGAQRRRRVC